MKIKKQQGYVALRNGKKIAGDNDLLRLRRRVRQYLIDYNLTYDGVVIINARTKKKLRP